MVIDTLNLSTLPIFIYNCIQLYLVHNKIVFVKLQVTSSLSNANVAKFMFLGARVAVFPVLLLVAAHCVLQRFT